MIIHVSEQPITKHVTRKTLDDHKITSIGLQPELDVSFIHIHYVYTTSGVFAVQHSNEVRLKKIRHEQREYRSLGGGAIKIPEKPSHNLEVQAFRAVEHDALLGESLCQIFRGLGLAGTSWPGGCPAEVELRKMRRTTVGQSSHRG